MNLWIGDTLKTWWRDFPGGPMATTCTPKKQWDLGFDPGQELDPLHATTKTAQPKKLIKYLKNDLTEAKWGGKLRRMVWDGQSSEVICQVTQLEVTRRCSRELVAFRLLSGRQCWDVKYPGPADVTSSDLEIRSWWFCPTSSTLWGMRIVSTTSSLCEHSQGAAVGGEGKKMATPWVVSTTASSSGSLLPPQAHPG